MTHGFTRITGLALAVLMLDVGPAWAGGYRLRGSGSDVKTDSNVDATGGISGGAPGLPSVGGSLNTDTTVDGRIEPNVQQPEEPSASPRLDTEPSARDHSPRDWNRPAPRSDQNMNRPDTQAPRSDQHLSQPGVQSPRVDDNQHQPDAQSPRSDRSPSDADQPLRSYKQ
jgi:hypothetical protein